MTKVIKTGDYVEVMDFECAGVKNGEQGMVIDDRNQCSLELMFPARNDCFSTGGYYVMADQLKRLYRPRT